MTVEELNYLLPELKVGEDDNNFIFKSSINEVKLPKDLSLFSQENEELISITIRSFLG